MIREQNAQAAIDAAVEFEKRGLGLTFKEGTFLQALHASATVDFKTPTNVAGASYEPSAVAIAAASAFVPMGMSVAPHDVMLDRTVIELAEALRGQVFFYKNTVRPAMKEFFERVQAAMQAMPAEATFNPQVVRVDVPLPLQSNLFEALVDEYAGAPYRQLSRNVGLPNGDREALPAMLKLGNSAIDGDIEAWAGMVGQDFLVDVYDNLFGQKFGAANASFSNPIHGADAALAAFLFGKKLLDNVPDGVTMSLTSYRTEIGEIVLQAGLRLANALADRAGYEKVGHMVLGADSSTVRVVASVYDKWLESGNNVAVLFGSLLSNRPATSAEGLSAGAAEYLSAWEQQNRNLTLTLQSRRYVDTISMLKFKTSQLVGERVKDFYGTLDESPGLNFDSPCVQAAKQRWEATIDSYTLEDLKDLWKVSLEIIAGGVFYFTDAQKFLSTLEGQLRDNPEMEPGQAVLLAEAELMADYIADQIDVFDL